MTVLQVGGLRFGFAGETLFQDVTFSLALGDRLCIVAPNGAGKTTLLRLIAGEMPPDEGSVTIRREVSVGYYRQSHELDVAGNVLDAFLSGFREILDLRQRLHDAQTAAASGLAADLDRLARLTDAYHLAHGDELERKVGILARRLGFSDRDLDRPVTSLSGGERGRLTLGVILAREPQLLLLDEPTNHLDLDTIAWLEGYLRDYAGAVIVVSHDRVFLDNTCKKTLELGVRQARLYHSHYSQYLVDRQENLERDRATQERQREFVERTEDFIRKNIAGQKTKQAQSRRKMLDKLERVDRPEDVWADAERIAFRFAPATRTGDIVLEAKGLSATRGDRVLFTSVDLLVRRKERIGIVGPNGSGKTTLLRLLAGQGAPDDRGHVKRGTNLEQGYFDQHLGSLDPSLTAVDEVRRIRGDYTVEVARQYLSRFRFWGDDTLRVVGGFSGGERSRLALAKLLLEPRNLLFLDEPTNHLDIPAAEILEEALVGFEGTVLFVSHDRKFLENVATRIVSVRDGRVEVFQGGFRDFEQSAPAKREPSARTGPKGASVPPVPPSVTGPPPKANATSKGPTGKVDYEAQRQEARALEKKKRRIVELERDIAKGEAELERMRAVLHEAPGDDWERVAKLAEEEQALARNVDRMLVEWARISEEVS